MSKEQIIEEYCKDLNAVEIKKVSRVMEAANWNEEYAEMVVKAIKSEIPCTILEYALSHTHLAPQQLWFYLQSLDWKSEHSELIFKLCWEEVTAYNRAICTVIKECPQDIDMDKAMNDYWYARDILKEKGLI